MLIRSAVHQSYLIPRAFLTEHLRGAKIEAMQLKKLKSIFSHAWRASEFYREKFAVANISPSDIQSIADLEKIPPTTKEELRDLKSEKILATGYSKKNTILQSTSGSSGKVLHIHYSAAAFSQYMAIIFRHLWRVGYRPWHRVATIAYGRPPPLPWEKIGLGKRCLIDLRKNDPRSYIKDLIKAKPHFILGFPSILQLIINHASDSELGEIRPKAIMLHSELLTDSVRNSISSAFGCDCYDDYSSYEFYQIAYECPHHNYHLAADNVIVEFVRNGQPVAAGEQGELLVTGLANKAMPLIRYQQGDVGVSGLGGCTCGIGFPTMQLIEGRVDDFVTLRSGRRFSPREINPVYEHLPGVLEHVLVQETMSDIKVYLEISPQHQNTTPMLVVNALSGLFTEPVNLEIIQTTNFERGKSGKLRNIVSKVSLT